MTIVSRPCPGTFTELKAEELAKKRAGPEAFIHPLAKAVTRRLPFRTRWRRPERRSVSWIHAVIATMRNFYRRGSTAKRQFVGIVLFRSQTVEVIDQSDAGFLDWAKRQRIAQNDIGCESHQMPRPTQSCLPKWLSGKIEIASGIISVQYGSFLVNRRAVYRIFDAI